MPVRTLDWPEPSRLSVNTIRVSRVMRPIFARRDFILVLKLGLAKKQSANLSATKNLCYRTTGPALSCAEAGQKAFRVDGRRAAQTGRRDRLPVHMIGTIPGHENAG